MSYSYELLYPSNLRLTNNNNNNNNNKIFSSLRTVNSGYKACKKYFKVEKAAFSELGPGGESLEVLLSQLFDIIVTINYIYIY